MTRRHTTKTVASVKALREIVETKSYAKVCWPHRENARERNPVTIDIMTAKALITVHDALPEENARKFAAMIGESPRRFMRCVDFAWRHVR